MEPSKNAVMEILTTKYNYFSFTLTHIPSFYENFFRNDNLLIWMI